MRISLGDVSLWFDVSGPSVIPRGDTTAERPVLVAVDGGPGLDHMTVKPALGPLADDFQVLYFDLRGHGRSDRSSAGSWNMRTWAGDLRRLCYPLYSATLGWAEESRRFLARMIRNPDVAAHYNTHEVSSFDPCSLTGAVRCSGKAHVAAILELLLTDHFQAWLDDASIEDVEELAGLIDAKLTTASDDENETMDDRLAELTGNLRAALDSRRTPDALAGALLAMVGQDREFALREGFGWGDERCRRYMALLIARGYEPTPIERELLDRYDPDTSDVPAVATA